MRIATEVKGYITAPPPPDVIYAPYDLAMDLSDSLVGRGHLVDFYAPEGSKLDKATLITLGQHTLVANQHEYTDKEAGILFNPAFHSDNILALYDQKYSAEMFRRAQKRDYDVLHFHHPEVALPFVGIYPEVPVVYTMHDPIDERQRKILEDYATPNQFFVSLSDFQRNNAPNLPYLATVYNGIDTTMFSYDPSVEKTDRLLFAGRIVPEKGVAEAVQVALESGHKLDIVGPVFPDSRDYFDAHVAPFLGKDITYLGHVPRKDLPNYYQRAKAFLAPVQWNEPFGLTLAESMATGTPVVALRKGAIPEVVAHEKTGFVVDSVELMVAAVRQLSDISPDVCRRRVEENFSLKSMVDGYEAVFKEAILRAKENN